MEASLLFPSRRWARALAAARRAWNGHWPEYLMEAAELGCFMVSACFFGTLLEHPSSPVRQAIEDPLLRRFLMGLAMGGTAVAVIHSPWGKQSGAHLNPSVTLTFLRLGKVPPADAVFYLAFQFLGGLAGVLAAGAVLRHALGHPAVRYVATLPGGGVFWGFLVELGISFVLMTVVLEFSNRPRLARFTPLCAGVLVAFYITSVAPISGMSMNPARTTASALPSGIWTGAWIYFLAPPVGMLLAAELYVARRGKASVFCAKLHHRNSRRCIFCAARERRDAVTAQTVDPPAGCPTHVARTFDSRTSSAVQQGR